MLNPNNMTIDEIINYGVPYDCDFALPIYELDKLCKDNKHKSKLYNRANEILMNNIGEYSKILTMCIKSKLIGTKRVLCFDSDFFLRSVLRDLGEETTLSELSGEQLFLYTKNYVRNIRNNLKNLNNLEELKELSPNFYKTIINNQMAIAILNNKERLNSFMKNYCDCLTRVLLNLKTACEELEKPIEEKYFSEIDKDKFMFFNACMSFGLSCVYESENDDKVHNSIYTTMKYMLEYNGKENIKLIDKDNKDNKGNKDKMCFYILGTEHIRFLPNYSYNKLFHHYKEYIKYHSDVTEEIIPSSKYEGKSMNQINEYFENYRLQTKKEKINLELQKKEEFNAKALEIKKLEEEKKRHLQEEKEKKEQIEALREELSLAWEVCPAGVRYTENSVHYLTPKSKNGDYEKLKYQEIYEQKLDFFENSLYIGHILGKEKFEGYEGYIYPNGIVLFEKLRNKKSISKSTALYVMDIRNFIEFSRLSKVEIMEIISSENEENLKRINHRENWQTRALNVINKKTDITLDEIKEKVNLLKKKIEN